MRQNRQFDHHVAHDNRSHHVIIDHHVDHAGGGHDQPEPGLEPGWQRQRYADPGGEHVW